MWGNGSTHENPVGSVGGDGITTNTQGVIGLSYEALVDLDGIANVRASNAADIVDAKVVAAAGPPGPAAPIAVAAAVTRAVQNVLIGVDSATASFADSGAPRQTSEALRLIVAAVALK